MELHLEQALPTHILRREVVLGIKPEAPTDMDAATLGAASAAITSPRTTRCMASAALTIAVENIKPNYRIAKTLAMALKRALLIEDDITAFAKAGERMLVYDDIR